MSFGDVEFSHDGMSSYPAALFHRVEQFSERMSFEVIGLTVEDIDEFGAVFLEFPTEDAVIDPDAVGDGDRDESILEHRFPVGEEPDGSGK